MLPAVCSMHWPENETSREMEWRQAQRRRRERRTRNSSSSSEFGTMLYQLIDDDGGLFQQPLPENEVTVGKPFIRMPASSVEGPAAMFVHVHPQLLLLQKAATFKRDQSVWSRLTSLAQTATATMRHDDPRRSRPPRSQTQAKTFRLARQRFEGEC